MQADIVNFCNIIKQNTQFFIVKILYINIKALSSYLNNLLQLIHLIGVFFVCGSYCFQIFFNIA